MADRDPLAGISIFNEAARSGSFTVAAERLGLTKSAVGKSIARLEERLGFKLFHRTTRRMRLTNEGEAYFDACSSAVEEITAAQEALESSNRVLSGRVHIDMPVAFGRRVLLPILLDAVRPHPRLSLTLTFLDATTDLVQEDVDLAIRFGDLKDSSNMFARHLVTQERVICASPEYLRSYGEPRSLADIAAHRCIVGSPKGPPLSWVVRESGKERRITPPPSHQIGDGEALVEAAVAGLGLCQLPASLVRDLLANGALKAVLRDHSSVPVGVHAVWQRQTQLSPRVRYVVDQLVAAAGKGMLS